MKIGLDEQEVAALLARMPREAVERARREGPRTREEIRGDVAGERRDMLRASRVRMWQETVRAWTDDDFSRAWIDYLTPGQKPGAVKAWIRDPDAKILILLGETGRGKTYTEFAIGNHYGHQGALVVAYSHKRYLDSLEPDGSDEPDYVIRRRAARADVLLLDGFGDEMDPTRPVSEFRARETNDLISARLGRGRRTVITTNLSSAQLGVMFGERTISRLRQGSTPLLIEGVDRRAHGAKW